MPNVVLCYPALDRHLDWIEDVLPDDWNLINAGQERIGEAIFEADVFCGHAKVPVDWAAVVEKNRLKWIQSSAAGLDHCLVPSVIDSSIPVTSCSGLFANQVAEQTMALLFGLFRQLPLFFRWGNDRRFERHPTWDLHGKTIGILGLGGNGCRIAELLAPLGNPILGCDWYESLKPASVSKVFGANEYHELLRQSDVVILGVPLNATTHHLMDAAAFEAMRPGSVLINVARGAVVDEQALVQALDNGHLAGAGIDVTEVEPLSEDSPLWGRDNVLITPHVGAQSAHRVDDSTKLFCANFGRWIDDQPLFNRVDKHLGFPDPSDRISLTEVRRFWSESNPNQ